MDKAAIENLFSHHPPSDSQKVLYEDIRAKFIYLAMEIKKNTRESAEQTIALRKLHEALMATNLTIACHPEVS